MGDGNLVHVDLGNVGDISKPANTLIEKISDALGGVLKPWQIRRVAKAQADALLIAADAWDETEGIKDRAIRRSIAEETRVQQNIEDITSRAIHHLVQESKPDALESDWLSFFFDRCRKITDEGMREHWARLLAQQSNHPGSISRRTITTMSELETADAFLFADLCNYSVVIDDKYEIVLLDTGASYIDPVYGKFNFEQLNHLASIGLITYDGQQSYSINDLRSDTVTYYCGKPYLAEFETAGREIRIGYALLTEVGRQLCILCDKKFDEDFLVKYLQLYLDTGARVSQPLRGN